MRRPRFYLSCVILAAALSAAAMSHADVVLDWNALTLDAVRTENSGPTLSSRNLAILHTAIYDAVNSVLRTHQPSKVQLDPLPGSSAEATAVEAA